MRYHSNWTQSFDNLKYSSKLNDALDLRDIKHLDISLAMSTLTLSDITKIFDSQFQPYESIKLNLGSINLGTQGIEYILSLLPTSVKSLELYFDSVHADSGAGASIANKLNQLSSLHHLKLSLILSGINDEGFINFFNNHKINKNLKSLQLVLIGNHMNATSLESLDKYLDGSRLETLGLNLYANSIQAQGAEYIAKALPKDIKNLDLDLYFNNITETGTEALT